MAQQAHRGGAAHGKVAVVAGDISAAGAEVARSLAATGAKVVLADLHEQAGRTLADDVGAMYVRLDVGDPASWDVVVEDLTDQLGSIDIALLSAGPPSGEGDLSNVTDEHYRRVLSTSLDGVVYGVRAVVPGMRLRGGGSVITAASLAGLAPMPSDPLHAMTAHAVVGLVRSLAAGLEDDRIRVNAVCPPFAGPVAEATSAPPGDPVGRSATAAPDPGAMARLVLAVVETTVTGRAWVLPAGREPVPHDFGDVAGHPG